MGKITFLGVEGSGKSTLTASLATWLSCHEECGWSLRPENKWAGLFSTRMTKKFAAGGLPAQTSDFCRLEWSLCYNGELQRTLEVLDYPGEVYRLAFLDPSEDRNPATLEERQKAHAAEVNELMAFLAESDQVFLLFNLDDANELETNDANFDAVWAAVSTLKVLTRLAHRPEITLLVTQADRLEKAGEDIGDIRALLKRRAPILLQHFKDMPVLAVSSLDADNPAWGIRPLLGRLLSKTDYCQTLMAKWKMIQEGLAADGAPSCVTEEMQTIASSVSWFVPDALKMIEDARLEWEEYDALSKEFDAIKNGEGKSRDERLKTLCASAKYPKCKKELEKWYNNYAADKADYGCFVGFAVFFVVVIFVFVIVMCSNAH